MHTLELSAMTHAGKVREVNEDRALAAQLSDGSVLLAVADGVGGMAAGDIASEEARLRKRPPALGQVTLTRRGRC